VGTVWANARALAREEIATIAAARRKSRYVMASTCEKLENGAKDYRAEGAGEMLGSVKPIASETQLAVRSPSQKLDSDESTKEGYGN
jgi:hypothetical protein